MEIQETIDIRYEEIEGLKQNLSEDHYMNPEQEDELEELITKAIKFGELCAKRDAKAQAAPEWISVNDKMPDEGDEVFVHHYGHIVQATKDQKYSGGFKQRNCYGWEAVSYYISHWMPMSVVLPESYHFYYGKPAKKAQEQSHD
ncbi:DUF551 domain-containing protein [Acinetobacter johnsonii]|uniref:DUF551 domain-containing protein n=1 Tax=Acinetobacter johnsonii TaxID=40214 RepID=A0AA42MCY1_ACIJO|nr:DUF551 domain-containing protein [Acinetobacter johnsonii]MDH0828105.1 DUF551 domain-containing protein [Acinetobacter johnsonii]